jgi:hypothetical protein
MKRMSNKTKTNEELMRTIRAPMAPPKRIHGDKRDKRGKRDNLWKCD